MVTEFKFRVTGFDGRSRITTKASNLKELMLEEWEKLFLVAGDMSEFFKRMEPMILEEVQDSFELGKLGVSDYGHWAQKWREAIGADPEGPNLLATGRLLRSFKRLTSRRGKEKTLSFGFTAPYAQEILEPHTWDITIDPENNTITSPSEGGIEFEVDVPGKDYITPLYGDVMTMILSAALEIKWETIERAMKK